MVHATLLLFLWLKFLSPSCLQTEEKQFSPKELKHNKSSLRISGVYFWSPHLRFLSWTDKSWIVRSLCLHTISECRNQRQDKAERACTHLARGRRAVLHPADASTPPPPSRRDVSLINTTHCVGLLKPPFIARTLRQDEKCSTLVSSLLRRPMSELTVYSTVNLPATNLVSQSAESSQNKMKHELRYCSVSTALFFTLGKTRLTV